MARSDLSQQSAVDRRSAARGQQPVRLPAARAATIARSDCGEAASVPARSSAPSALLDTLYRSNAARLRRYFARRIGRNDADDLVQETFARCARTLDNAADPVATPDAYLTRVATNLLRDRARLAARQALDLRQIAGPDDASTDPHRQLELRETLRRLEGAIDQLRPTRRRIFLLHRLHHLTYEQIADETGMSVKGVKKQMAKALRDLRRRVGTA